MGGSAGRCGSGGRNTKLRAIMPTSDATINAAAQIARESQSFAIRSSSARCAVSCFRRCSRLSSLRRRNTSLHSGHTTLCPSMCSPALSTWPRGQGMRWVVDCGGLPAGAAGGRGMAAGAAGGLPGAAGVRQIGHTVWPAMATAGPR